MADEKKAEQKFISPEDLRESTTLGELNPLLAKISHDLKNAIAIVGGFTELTLMDASLKQAHRENLEKVMEGIKRAKEQLARMPLLNTVSPKTSIPVPSKE